MINFRKQKKAFLKTLLIPLLIKKKWNLWC